MLEQVVHSIVVVSWLHKGKKEGRKEAASLPAKAPWRVETYSGDSSSLLKRKLPSFSFGRTLPLTAAAAAARKRVYRVQSRGSKLIIKALRSQSKTHTSTQGERLVCYTVMNIIMCCILRSVLSEF